MHEDEQKQKSEICTQEVKVDVKEHRVCRHLPIYQIKACAKVKVNENHLSLKLRNKTPEENESITQKRIIVNPQLLKK